MHQSSQELSYLGYYDYLCRTKIQQMKTILVPISSFENGLTPLKYAISFAAEIDAKIYVLKVYGANKIAGSIKTVGSILEKDTKKELRELIHSVDKKDVEIIATTMEGTLADSIQLMRKKINIDLMISASNRIFKDETIYIGKITGKIIKAIDCPILIVPDKYEYKPIQVILMGIKSGIIKRENVLSPLHFILDKIDAKLNLLQVITPKLTEDDLNLDRELNSICTSVQTSENATIFQGVLEHLIENKPDMLCVIRRKRGFFSKLWDQDFVKKIDFESRIPLLILRGSL